MIVALLMVFELINYADRSVMALSAEYLMDDLNISEATYGLISSSFYFLFAITAIGVGFTANRFQLKWILLIMATAWAVGLNILGYGLGIAAMPISYAVAGTLATPSQRPSVLGLFVGLQSLAGLVAPWCTGMLVAAADTKVEGYNLAFTLLGLAIIGGGVIFAIGTNPERDNIRSEAEPAGKR